MRPNHMISYVFLLINKIVHQLLSSFDLRPVGRSDIDGRLIDKILGLYVLCMAA